MASKKGNLIHRIEPIKANISEITSYFVIQAFIGDHYYDCERLGNPPLSDDPIGEIKNSQAYKHIKDTYPNVRIIKRLLVEDVLG